MLTERLAPHVTPTRAPAPAGELRYSVADISAARRALGYSPTRTLATDLDGVIADIKSRLR